MKNRVCRPAPHERAGQLSGECSVADTLTHLIASAAACGMAQSVRFPDMTPREVHTLLTAHAAWQTRRHRDLLTLAHLAAIAFHAPERLPAPDAVSGTPPDALGTDARSSPGTSFLPDMTDEEMKRRLSLLLPVSD